MITRSRKPLFALICLCVVFLLLDGQVLKAEPQEQIPSAKIWFIPVRGDIEPSLGAFVRREARNAISQGAGYIIFEIDTFGGRVDTALQIASFITSIDSAKTVAWVNSGESSMGVSWSAGALIALSCNVIYMAPGTSIGAAAPVMASPGGGAEAAGEKTVAAVRSQMASLAEKNGHPAGLALAMVDYDVELTEYIVDGDIKVLTEMEYTRLRNDGASPELVGVVSPPGKLLSLTAVEAHRYGLAAGLAGDRESLLGALGVRGEPVEASPNTADSFISFLNSGAVQALLILLGLVLIFVEINSPGFGVPGVAGVLAFLAVFVPSAMIGRVGSLEIILFLLGLGLLAVELFILPGFGIIGISGIALIGFSLMFSMQDFVIPQFEWELELFGRNALVVVTGLVLGITGIAIIALMGPRIRIFNWITLKTQITGTSGGPEPGSDTEDDGYGNYESLEGKTGMADSILRPSGRVMIDGRIYSVETESEFIDEGSNVQVTRVRGNRIIVKKI